MTPEHLRGHTYHKRLGAKKNAFRYSVDYVLIDPEGPNPKPWLFSRNRFNLMSLHDRDHGGERGAGRGVAWAQTTFQQVAGPYPDDWRVLLLAQPRMFNAKFTPVSFWLLIDAENVLRGAIAEVNNTFGDRHSYLCALPDYGVITKEDTLQASKVFHVSPFQPVDGGYRFNFDIDDDHVSIRIDYRHESGGVIATLDAERQPLRDKSILASALRRPFGAIRVLGLIHYQALKLWRKGAGYRPRPEPPAHSVSR